MSTKNRHTSIGLLTLILILIVIDSFVVIRFFTDDKFKEVTFSQASLINYEETIPTQITKPENPEVFISKIHNEDALKNTNETKIDKTIINSNESISPQSSDEVINTKTITSSRSSADRRNVESTTPSSTASSPPKSTSSSTSSTTQQSQSEPIASSSTIPAGHTSIGTIVIPKTNVNLPILSKVSVDGMEVATCFLYSTGSINQSGTTIIVGHNYCNGKLFSNNKQLQIGDKIYITTNGNKVEYTVYDKLITTENDVSYVEKNTTNQPEIALSTCTDNEEKRLVILAK